MAPLKIISWNLYYRDGAVAEDIAELVHQHQPDLVLMQEVTLQIHHLPREIDGHFYRQPWPGKRYGLAVWAPRTLKTYALPLPYSKLPGKFPPRAAQIIETGKYRIANVHLSHGQVLNRRQLLALSKGLPGTLAIIGDFNLVGPVAVPTFKDVGPRKTTHRASGVVPFRLDRCLIRGMRCTRAEVLNKGASDHHPIYLELAEPEPLPQLLLADMSHNSA